MPYSPSEVEPMCHKVLFEISAIQVAMTSFRINGLLPPSLFALRPSLLIEILIFVPIDDGFSDTLPAQCFVLSVVQRSRWHMWRRTVDIVMRRERGDRLMSKYMFRGNDWISVRSRSRMEIAVPSYSIQE